MWEQEYLEDACLKRKIIVHRGTYEIHLGIYKTEVNIGIDKRHANTPINMVWNKLELRNMQIKTKEIRLMLRHM
mgnify:CR=1 FL=1